MNAPAPAVQSADMAQPSMQVKLYWQPDKLVLKTGSPQNVRLYYNGHRQVHVRSDCQGKVRIRDIGFARIKHYHIRIFEAGTLRAGPLHCAVEAGVKEEPRLKAVLPIDVLP